LPVGASYIRQLCQTYTNLIRDKYRRHLRSPRFVTFGSWPNWEFYLHHSRVVQELWERKNPVAVDLFRQILGYNPFVKPISEYRGRERVLLERLLTLKIWLDLERISDR
jgi:hypothetical protein